METQLEWLVAGRVLYAARSGAESLDALEEFTRRVIQHLEQDSQPPVHLIWNMSGLKVEGVDRRQAMSSLNRILKHPNLEWFVVIDREMPLLRRFMAATVLRLTGIHWRTVGSRDEALAFLHRADSSLSAT